MAIKALKSLKIKTVMLTGDSQAAAMHAQNEVRLYFSLVENDRDDASTLATAYLGN